MPLRLRLASSFAAVMLLGTAVSIPTYVSAQQNGSGVSTVGAYLSANAAASRSDLLAAAYFYRVIFDRNPGNTQLAARVLLLWTEAGEIDEAARMADVVLSANAGYEPARMVLASRAIQDGDFGVAQMHLDAIAGDSLARVTSGVLTAWMSAGNGEIDVALEHLADMDESRLFQAFHAALIADLDGRSDLALAFISKVYEPGSSQRLTEAFARILARNGLFADAESVLADFLSNAPNHPTLGPLLNDIRAGAEIAPMVETAQQGAAELFYGLASSLVGDQAFDTAIIYLQFARYIGASGDMPAALLGQILQAQQRHGEAALVFDSIGAESPFYRLAAIGASLSDSRLGFTERAAARLEPITAADPKYVDAASALAGIYASQQRWDDVIALLTTAIDLAEVFQAEDWQIFYQRGVALERVGRWEEAEVEFRRALALSPDQPDVLNYLGYTWVDRGENLIEGLDMIERAAELSPNSGAIIDSLGWAYYQLGDFEIAVAALETAVLLSPSHPVILEHLGDAYWRVGRTLEAGYKWSQALGEEPDEDMAERLRDKLDSGLPTLADGAAGGVFEIN